MILLVFFCAVSQISAENPDNATLATDEIQEEISIDEVQTTDDVLTDSEIDYHPFSEIQEAINDADDGDTISLTGYFKGSGNQIVVDKAITIAGPEDDYAYLTADGLSRIFYIESSGVVLKNLIMVDGDATDYEDAYGGAVCTDDDYGNCKIEDCYFENCQADYGGATYWCDVHSSKFNKNSAEYGGAMYGGNVYESDFINNTASDMGGAIYLRDNCIVDDCYFEDNEAESGGAIYSCAYYNTVSKSEFYNNYASDDGGAIYNNDEEDSGLKVESCVFKYNEADDDGGAIFTVDGADTIVADSTFEQNDAGYWGGAMCRGVAKNSTFKSNSAVFSGGGIYKGEASNCSFTGNTPDDTYETVISDTDDIDYQPFSAIQDKIDKAKSGDTISLTGYYKGSGTQITVNKKVTIQGPEDGYAFITAAGLSRIFYVTASGVVLKNLVLKAGDAEYNNGGAVYCDAYDNCRIEGCVIGYCEAEYGGATYYCDVYDSVFLANSAERGGAMYGGNAYNSGFANNTASDRGGAIYLRDGCTVDHCEFENNTASDGGAVYSCADHNVVSYSNFKYNHADDDGGAIYNNNEYDSGLKVIHCDFRFNDADDDGGAIYTESDADTVVEDSYFWENEANWYGGAMCRGSVYDSSFYLNDAKYGGGMYYGEAYDCSFSWNTPENVYETDVYRIITGKIILSQSGSYFGDKTVSARVVDTNNNNAPVANVPVTFKFTNGKSAIVYTGSNGFATYSVPFNPGTYSVTATIPASYSASAVSMGNIRISKAPATIQPKKLTTKYGTCKSFKVRVINSKTKKGIGGVKLLLKVYTGKKAKKVHVTTDSSGNAYYSPSKLKVGKHKVKVSVAAGAVTAKAKKSKITVKKASVGLNTYDGIWYYKDVKKGKYYIGVYNKNSGQYLKGIKLKVKVYTGKKSKTYTVKTKKDGYAILKTKGIKVGKHKVKITFKGNKNFKKASAKATIEVTKKIPTRTGYYYMFTSYSYWGYGSRSVKAFVKDIHGNDLTNKKITIYGSLGGTTTGYSGDMISLPSGSTVVMKFAGDKKYMPSTFTIHFV